MHRHTHAGKLCSLQTVAVLFRSLLTLLVLYLETRLSEWKFNAPGPHFWWAMPPRKNLFPSCSYQFTTFYTKYSKQCSAVNAISYMNLIFMEWFLDGDFNGGLSEPIALNILSYPLMLCYAEQAQFVVTLEQGEELSDLETAFIDGTWLAEASVTKSVELVSTKVAGVFRGTVTSAFRSLERRQ